MSHSHIQYQPDILGAGYEQATLTFPDDYEGPVVATLVRKKSSGSHLQSGALYPWLYRLFSKPKWRNALISTGFDFYALDLRKYGGSIRPHQNFYNVHELSEYDAEIDQALTIIADEGHDALLLCGHSTGGLTTTLYAAHHQNHPLIQALWVNSPFYDFNMNPVKRALGIPQPVNWQKPFPI